MTSMKKEGSRKPCIVRVNAPKGEGIFELVEAIESVALIKGRVRLKHSSDRMRNLIVHEARNVISQRLRELESPGLDAICEGLARGALGYDQAVLDAIRLVTAARTEVTGNKD